MQRTELSDNVKEWITSVFEGREQEREKQQGGTRPQQYLLPGLHARLVWMVRGAVTAAVTSAFILTGTGIEELGPGVALIPVTSLFTTSSTLGSSIRSAFIIVVAGAISAAYSASVTAIFAGAVSTEPETGGSLAVALVGTFVFAFFASYSHTSALAKRISISSVVLCLFLFYQNPTTTTIARATNSGPDTALRTWAGLCIGACFGVGSSILPLPITNTATKDLSRRLQLGALSMKAMLGALTIAFTHKPMLLQEATPVPVLTQKTVATTTTTPSTSSQAPPRSQSVLDDKLELVEKQGELEAELEIEEKVQRYSEQSQEIGIRPSATLALRPSSSSSSSTDASSPATDVSTQHLIPIPRNILPPERVPLLRADIADLHDTWLRSLPALFTSLNDMDWEIIGTSQQHPFSASKDNIGLKASCKAWAEVQIRLHRALGVCIAAESSLRSSKFHASFVIAIQNELCHLITTLGDYLSTSVAYSTSFQLPLTRTATRSSSSSSSSFHSSSTPVVGGWWSLFLSRIFLTFFGVPVTSSLGNRAEAKTLLHKKRKEVERATAAVFVAYQRGRMMLYPSFSTNAATHGTTTSTTTTTPPTSAQPHFHSPVYDSSSLSTSPSTTTSSFGWHADDLLALNAFLFSILRCTQMILAVSANHDSHSRQIGIATIHHLQEKHPHSFSLLRQSEVVPYLRRLRLRFFPPWTIQEIIKALKVAAAITLAGGLAVALKADFGASVYFWAPVTASFLVGGPGSSAGSYRTSIMRLQGTFGGAVYGYLVIVLFASCPVCLGAALVVWSFLLTYARAHPVGGYTALVALLTASILILGLGPRTATAEELALGKIKQTVLGVVCYLVVANVFFPISARTLARARLASSLSITRKSLSHTIQAFVHTVQQQADDYNEQMKQSKMNKRMHRRQGQGDVVSRSCDPLATKAKVANDKDRHNNNNNNNNNSDRGSCSNAAATSSTSPLHSHPPSTSSSKATHQLQDPLLLLEEVDATLAILPGLLDEAALEPSLMRPNFATLKSRYQELMLSIQRVLRGILSIHQCTSTLLSEAEAQYKLRRRLRQNWHDIDSVLKQHERRTTRVHVGENREAPPGHDDDDDYDNQEEEEEEDGYRGMGITFSRSTRGGSSGGRENVQPRAQNPVERPTVSLDISTNSHDYLGGLPRGSYLFESSHAMLRPELVSGGEERGAGGAGGITTTRLATKYDMRMHVTGRGMRIYSPILHRITCVADCLDTTLDLVVKILSGNQGNEVTETKNNIESTISSMPQQPTTSSATIHSSTTLPSQTSLYSPVHVGTSATTTGPVEELLTTRPVPEETADVEGAKSETEAADDEFLSPAREKEASSPSILMATATTTHLLQGVDAGLNVGKSTEREVTAAAAAAAAAAAEDTQVATVPRTTTSQLQHICRSPCSIFFALLRGMRWWWQKGGMISPQMSLQQHTIAASAIASVTTATITPATRGSDGQLKEPQQHPFHHIAATATATTTTSAAAATTDHPIHKLPFAVDLLLHELSMYSATYNELMHAVVQGRAVRQYEDGDDDDDDDDGTVPSTNNLTGSMSTGDTTPPPPPSSSSSTPPHLAISNLDAMCFNTTSFALQELGEAICDVARVARRIVHTEASAAGGGAGGG